MRRVLPLVAMVVVALLPGVPAHADQGVPTAAACSPVVLYNRHSGKVLEVYHSSTADGATVDQWSYNGSNTQKWCLSFIEYHNGLPEYYVVNHNSGKCLDLANGTTANGAKVQQWRCNGNPQQQWAVTQPASHVYMLAPNTIANIDQGWSYVLEVNGWSTANGGKVDIWQSHIGANQEWNCSCSL